MTSSIGAVSGPRRVLEVGPGTGPFTKAILKKLRAGDRFELVEINQNFCRKLEKDLLTDFRLHCAPIEEAQLSGPFDVIVCGLPFNNFPPKLMRQIFRRMFALLKEDGELVYFEYAGVRVIKGSVMDRDGRARLKRIDTIGKSMQRKHEGKQELVLGNFPPAITYRLKGLPTDALLRAEALGRARKAKVKLKGVKSKGAKGATVAKTSKVGRAGKTTTESRAR